MKSRADQFAEALALQRAGRVREAAEAYGGLAVAGLSADLAGKLALCLTELGDLDAAQAWLDRAPTPPGDPAQRAARLALCEALLMQGRYRQAWPLMEARIAARPDLIPPVNPSFPPWRGEPLDGKSIVVWIEQGFGDQIMFARFASSLAGQGARVSLACRPALAALFATLAGVDAVVPVDVGQAVPVDRHDYWSRYASLPLHLGVTLETLPARPYLSAPPDRASKTRGGVGLAWKTSPTGANAAAKRLPDEQARRLLDRGAVSLHPEDTGAVDFADTAAIIAGLDLVISVDTAVAHLAGAMGKPVLILLPAVGTDWRWMRAREDSPWYPSARLLRQQPGEAWEPVVDRAIARLPAG